MAEISFEKYKIITYEHWELFLHKYQFPYLGRCYAWAKREDAKRTIDMGKTERDELFDIIIPEWDKAINELFQHDWHNISSLGNTSPHLHWHLIPRYQSEKIFYNMKFIDPNPKGNYAPYPKQNISQEILEKIKSDISKII